MTRSQLYLFGKSMLMMKPHEVSFLLFAYNQETTIAAAVSGALNQVCEPLDIILSDDGSSDDTFVIIQQIAASYDGPHRVRTRKSPANRGWMNHVYDVVGAASGRLLVFAAGDDVSLPGRTTAIVEAWQDSGGCTAAIYSDYFPVDEQAEAVELGKGYFFAGQHTLNGMARGFIEALGGSAAYTPDLFSRFPKIAADVIQEDRVLPFRAELLGGKVIVIEQKLVRYRVTGGVSRQVHPTGMQDFARRFFPNQQRRLLPDARQRERDAATALPDDKATARFCRATTATHEAIIRLSEARGIGIEFALARSLQARGRFKPILKHYLKLRLPVPYRGKRQPEPRSADQ